MVVATTDGPVRREPGQGHKAKGDNDRSLLIDVGTAQEAENGGLAKSLSGPPSAFFHSSRSRLRSRIAAGASFDNRSVEPASQHFEAVRVPDGESWQRLLAESPRISGGRASAATPLGSNKSQALRLHNAQEMQARAFGLLPIARRD